MFARRCLGFQIHICPNITMSGNRCLHLMSEIVTMTLLLQAVCVSVYALGESDLNRELPEELDFYSYPVMDIFDDIVSLEKYRGKVSLVVNVASECGYTDNHYKGLNLLQEIFSETKKFNVLAFPCNQFGEQEPGSAKEIHNFVYNRMGATFPLFAKIKVKDHDVPPAWRYLIKHSGNEPNWNFWKYLVDHNGHVIKSWGPSISPDQLYQHVKNAIDKIDAGKSSDSAREDL